MNAWARNLPVVTVPLGEPKAVTFVYPYYMNALFFQTQVDGWFTYGPDIWPHVSVIVVDDGSPQPAQHPSVLLPMSVRLFRIYEDRRWNWLTARNIGAYHAADGWLLLTDMDHVVREETARAIVYGQHDPTVIYAFSRREHTDATIPPHSASFLMTRKLFWTIGGYDEALAGLYGTDGEFRRRARQHAPIQVLSDTLVRYEFVQDASTTQYQRKQPEDAAVARLVAARGPSWTPKTLSFEYREVSA